MEQRNQSPTSENLRNCLSNGFRVNYKADQYTGFSITQETDFDEKRPTIKKAKIVSPVSQKDQAVDESLRYDRHSPGCWTMSQLSQCLQAKKDSPAPVSFPPPGLKL